MYFFFRGERGKYWKSSSPLVNTHTLNICGCSCSCSIYIAGSRWKDPIHSSHVLLLCCPILSLIFKSAPRISGLQEYCRGGLRFSGSVWKKKVSLTSKTYFSRLCDKISAGAIAPGHIIHFISCWFVCFDSVAYRFSNFLSRRNRTLCVSIKYIKHGRNIRYPKAKLTSI